MPRHNRRREPAPLRSSITSSAAREQWQGQWWTVRSVPGASATKAYRCPGCAQLIPIGVPHVVVWPETDLEAGDRRHWHRPCWSARERRFAR